MHAFMMNRNENEARSFVVQKPKTTDNHDWTTMSRPVVGISIAIALAIVVVIVVAVVFLARPKNSNATPFRELQARCPAIVINLDRSTDRWATVQRNIREAGFRNVVRHSGVDCRDPEALRAGWERHGSPEFDVNDGSFVGEKKGKQGCFLSHVDVLRRIIDSRIPCAFVFEDDVVFHPEFRTLAPRYFDELTPPDFDLVFIGCQTVPERPVPVETLVARNVPVFGLHAYMITLDGAKKLYASLLGPGPRRVYTIDCMIIDQMRSGRAPYTWYIWHGRKFAQHSNASVKHSHLLQHHKNAGLVYQDVDLPSIIFLS